MHALPMSCEVQTPAVMVGSNLVRVRVKGEGEG